MILISTMKKIEHNFVELKINLWNKVFSFKRFFIFYLRILLYVICSPEKCGSKNTFHNLCSTGAFRDSGAGAGAGLGNFWKRWVRVRVRVRVRRDSAIKQLLKIFLFIFSIYFYY